MKNEIEKLNDFFGSDEILIINDEDRKKLRINISICLKIGTHLWVRKSALLKRGVVASFTSGLPCANALAWSSFPTPFEGEKEKAYCERTKGHGLI